LVSVVNSRLLRMLESDMDRAEHYRILSQAAGPRSWSVANAEHEAIVDAFRRRDGQAAGSRLGSHLAMTALTLIAQLAPTYDPAALRAAAAAAAAIPAPNGADKGRRVRRRPASPVAAPGSDS